MLLFSNSSPRENYEFGDADYVAPLYDLPESEVEDPLGGEDGITIEDAEPAKRND